MTPLGAFLLVYGGLVREDLVAEATAALQDERTMSAVDQSMAGGVKGPQ
jgi:hypothetical protein